METPAYLGECSQALCVPKNCSQARKQLAIHVKKALDGSSNNWVGTTAKHYQDRAVAYRARLKPVDAS